MRRPLVFALAGLASFVIVLALASFSSSHFYRDFTPAAAQSPLPKIGPAPQFMLTSQAGVPVSLSDLRCKLVAVTFIFTRCTDTSPVLTPMISFVQDRL